MSDRIILRTGEALVEREPSYLCAEPEVVIGEPDRRSGQGSLSRFCDPQ
jgi:5,6,7,8-tetrahydromethanopterin hydro-lyase